jgi:hypothetical protein
MLFQHAKTCLTKHAKTSQPNMYYLLNEGKEGEMQQLYSNLFTNDA